MEVPFRRLEWTTEYEYVPNQQPVLEALGVILMEKAHAAPGSLEGALNQATLLRPFGKDGPFWSENGPRIVWSPEAKVGITQKVYVYHGFLVACEMRCIARTVLRRFIDATGSRTFLVTHVVRDRGCSLD